MTTVVLYATDTMADWEYGYLTAGLAMGGVNLVVASEGAKAVTTAGRLVLQPGADLATLDADDIDLLVLPGADTWAEGHERALDLTKSLLSKGKPVAAICGATLGLARTGELDERRHTSNAPEFLGEYGGGALYEQARTVSDNNVITAPATAPLEFAKAVFERLGVFPQSVIDAWYGLYTTGERKYFDRLTGAQA